MAEKWELEERQKQAIERMEHQDRLTRRRSIEAENRRIQRQTEASIADHDSMELQHKLNIENRQLDHQFNRAEDARELARIATETTLRRRDDFIREQWAVDERLQNLEGVIIGKIADAKIAQRQSELDHNHNLEAKQFDHANAIEMATHANELDKDNFEFKERLRSQLSSESSQADSERAKSTIEKLKREGKI